jgi:dihydroorotase
MIHFTNVRHIDGTRHTIQLESTKQDDVAVDGSHLTRLPGLIDPHVHFRTPGHEYKEDWRTGARAAIAGGITTVFDMPNTSPSCTTKERLQAKKRLIQQQLNETGIPLRHHLYFGADAEKLNQIFAVQQEIIGLKIYMGSSTGSLLMENEGDLTNAFRLCAERGILIGVHAEDEPTMRLRKKALIGVDSPDLHSQIRSPEVAVVATERAIRLSEKFGTLLVILHMSTAEEVRLVRAAKAKGLPVYAETTPHHLFLTDRAYCDCGHKVQMNPPLRREGDLEALWEGIADGTIDTLGTDHAPHTLQEKDLPYGQAPSGVPGIETILPLMLNAVNEGRLSLERVVELMHGNIERIYGLSGNSDFVLVDMEREQVVNESNLKTKCGWSPFAGWRLKGWPEYVGLRGKVYECATARPLELEVASV